MPKESIVPTRRVDTSWVTDRVVTFAETVASLVPEGYPAYARIFHPAQRLLDGSLVPVRWSDVAAANSRALTAQVHWIDITGDEFLHSGRRQPGVWDDEPQEGYLPTEVAQRLGDVLLGHTTSPDHCVYAVWEGWGRRSHLDLARSQVLALPYRRHLLLEGPCQAVTSFGPRLPGPNLWWPDDRAWFVATEVDDMSTFIAGDRVCIDDVLATTDLETVEVGASDRLSPAGR